MGERRSVVLRGGPLDGQSRTVDATRDLITFEFAHEAGVWAETRAQIATYRRGPDGYRYVRTPTHIGDPADGDCPRCGEGFLDGDGFCSFCAFTAPGRVTA